MDNRYGWVIVAAGALITCLAMGAIFALPVYLQPIADDTGWSRAGISLAMTAGFVVMGVAGFGWGTLSDRIGARPVVLMAALLLGAGLIIASRASNLLVFQIAYGGIACASVGAFFAPLMATTVGWFDKHRSLAVSLVSIGGGVAPMVMTPFATILIGAYGWRSAMLMIAGGVTLVVLATALLIRPAPAAEAAAPAPAGHAAPPSGAASPWSALRTPQFVVLAATFFLCCAAHSGPIFHTVSYAELCGASALAAASIYSVEGVAGLVGRIVFGLLADRVGVKRVIIGGLALQAVGIYSYIFVNGLGDFYIRALILGMAYGGVMPLYSILARSYFSQGVMGTVLGAATMTSSIGMAFGPVGGGWLFDRFGTYHWLYIASAAIGIAAAVMALAFPPPRRRDEEPGALQLTRRGLAPTLGVLQTGRQGAGGSRTMLAKGARLLAVLATAATAAPSGLVVVAAPARADGACVTWSTYEEQDAAAANLTAIACSSSKDDSSVIGLQCPGRKPQLRYYPGDFAQQTIRNNTRLAVNLAVGDNAVAKTMRYTSLDGVFSVTIGKTDPVLALLQSGGPLDLSSTTLGTHRFRLVGSNAAIARVLHGCGIKDYLAPPPPLPGPDPRQND